MKATIIVISCVLILGVLYMFNVFSQKPVTTTAQQLTFQAVQTDITSGGQLIDVRSPEEYAAGHIKGAINLDVVAIQAGSRPKVAKTAKIYVYCRSGARSSHASSVLRTAGFTNIVDLGAMAKVQTMGGSLAN